MKADELSKAHNPQLSAALTALRRAALRARREAQMTHTGIVVIKAGKVARIDVNQVKESSGVYATKGNPDSHEDDS